MNAGVVTGLLLLTGCDRVFSGQYVPPDDAVDAVVTDAPGPATITGSIVHRWAEGSNDSDAVPRVGPLAATLSAFLEDGTQLAVDYFPDAGGELSFTVPVGGARYRLVMEGPTINTVEVQHTAPTLALVHATLGRTDRTPPTMTTIVNVPSGGSNPLLVSTGVYAQVATKGNNSPDSVDWRAVRSFSPPTGLVRASRNDRLYYFRRTLADLTALGSFIAMSQLSVDMMDGGMYSVPPNFTTLTPNGCARLAGGFMTSVARLRAVPGGYIIVEASWNVLAAPAADITRSGISIAGALEMTNSELSRTAKFHDPFVGMTHLGTMRVTARRTYLMPGAATAVELSASLGMTAKLDNTPLDCSAPVVNLEPDVAIPGAITVADNVLVSDSEAVTLPASGPVVVTWQLVDEGSVDAYFVTLYEVKLSNTATTLGHLRNVLTIDRRATFEPTLFEVGKQYLLRIDGIRGFPNATTGDVATLVYPVSDVHVHSFSFTVSQ